MPTSQFPTVNPVDPTSQLNAIQSTVNAIKSPIIPTKPRVIQFRQSGTNVSTYYTAANISGKGSLNKVVFADINNWTYNESLIIRLTIDGSSVSISGSTAPFYVAGSFLSYAPSASGAVVLEYNGPVFFQSTCLVEVYNGQSSNGIFQASIHYAIE